MAPASVRRTLRRVSRKPGKRDAVVQVAVHGWDLPFVRITLRALSCEDEAVNGLYTSVMTLPRWVYMYMLR